MLLLPINVTFKYEFTVANSELRMQKEFGSPSEELCWAAQGSGQADELALQWEARMQAVRDAASPAERERMDAIAKYVRAGRGARGIEDPPASFQARAEGLAGPNPKFELCGGWLTLLPTEGWTQALPVHWFSDARARLADYPHGMRNLKSFSIYVGEALQNAMRAGDTLRFSRNHMGDFSYRLEKNGEMICSAGGLVNEGGPVALWQEFDSVPNPSVGQATGRISVLRRLSVAEQINVVRPYVSVRVNDQVSHLLDGEDAFVDPHYVFLARSNYSENPLHGLDGHYAPAVYGAGRIGDLRKELTKELIKIAAHQLTAPKTRTL
jgi:hypothetical protein